MTTNNNDQGAMANEAHWMQQAIELAKLGQGQVEPNPMVGCVLVKDNQLIGEGYHQKFGGPHAEVNAILSAAESVAGATAFVTLEPCSHHGKTGPCVEALIAAKIARVMVAHSDPNPLVAGRGIAALVNAGIKVQLGLLNEAAAEVLAPYLKRIERGLPWIIGKWAMTWDGKIATASGDSQWISNERSRAVVHQLRGRVDAVMVGARTASADDPLLTARPSGPRIATRIVVDSLARLSVNSKLVQTARDFPTLLAVGPAASVERCSALEKLGCEIWQSDSMDSNERLLTLLHWLSERGMTNVLVEGGGQLLGSLNDLNQIDETHVFMGPKILGGANSLTPVGGVGVGLMSKATKIGLAHVEQFENDVYLIGRRVV